MFKVLNIRHIKLKEDTDIMTTPNIKRGTPTAANHILLIISIPE